MATGLTAADRCAVPAAAAACRAGAAGPGPRLRADPSMTTTDPAMVEVPAADFRHAIGHFATGVTVVTSIGTDGEPVGTTANAVRYRPLDPPPTSPRRFMSATALRIFRHRSSDSSSPCARR